MSHWFIFSIFALLLLALPVSVTAQTPDCTIIYGGGKVDCSPTEAAATPTQPTPTPQPIVPSNTTNATKGGLPVEQPAQATTTPGTGPELLSLAALIPAGAMGIYLRRKTK
ncbi:MAG TPA: hypothetical protein VLF20_00915 [Patescibacteria group bacterium]|nr:hypothetical protein [Patescibacteria group bacterium]